MECWLLGYFAKFTLPISQVHFAKLQGLHCYFAMLTLSVCQVDIAQLLTPHCQVCKEPSLKFERAIQSGKERERGKREGNEGVSLGSLWKKKKWGAVWVLGKPEELFWHWTAQIFFNLWAGWTSFRQSTAWSGPGNWPCWCAVANLGMQALQYGLCNLANWTWQTGKVNLAN